MSLPYNSPFGNISDSLDTLPTDESTPTGRETEIIDQLFPASNTPKLIQDFKDVLVVGAIFFVINISPIDRLIQKYVSVSESSEYAMIGIKALLGMILYFVIKYFYLMKK